MHGVSYLFHVSFPFGRSHQRLLHSATRSIPSLKYGSTKEAISVSLSHLGPRYPSSCKAVATYHPNDRPSIALRPYDHLARYAFLVLLKKKYVCEHITNEKGCHRNEVLNKQMKCIQAFLTTIWVSYRYDYCPSIRQSTPARQPRNCNQNLHDFFKGGLGCQPGVSHAL